MINTHKNDLNSKSLSKIGMEIDPHASLYQSDDKIFRAIHSQYSKFYSALLDQPFIIDLIEKGTLISTKKSSKIIEGHDLVLEHPRLTYVTYPFEWTPSAFKQAAITILELNIELMQHGYCTQDAHPWNVLFDGVNPIFIDFTSIIKLPEDGNWPALAEFNNYCSNSLILMSKGLHGVARAILREIFSFPDQTLIRSLPFGDHQNNNRAINELKKIADVISFFSSRVTAHLHHRFVAGGSTSLVQVLKKLLEDVKYIDVDPKQAEWSNYYEGLNELPPYDGTVESLEQIKSSTPKHAAIARLLSQIKPATVLDIGCNRGIYSQMAAGNGAKVVGIDMDEYALDRMYIDARKAHTSVTPLYVNSVAPAEAIGFKEIPFPTVTERLKSDCVLCLALVHHLVFKRTQMDFSHIAQVLSSFSRNHLIVEFVPREDKHVREWFNDDYDWYSCENFRDELKKFFSSVEIFESFPSPRLLLHCSKKII